MTDNEIKAILEEFSECGIVHHNIASVDFIKSVLDLINRLKEEKQNLEIELKAMRGAANSYKAENERLKESRDRWRRLAEDFNRITREEELGGEDNAG